MVSRPERRTVPASSPVSGRRRRRSRAATITCSIADRLGVEALAAAGQVVARDRAGPTVDGRGVEHDEVGVPALGDAAPVAQAVAGAPARRSSGCTASSSVNRPAVADRVAEHDRRVVGVAHEVEVRAGVGAAEHDPVVAPDLGPRLPSPRRSTPSDGTSDGKHHREREPLGDARRRAARRSGRCRARRRRRRPSGRRRLGRRASVASAISMQVPVAERGEPAARRRLHGRAEARGARRDRRARRAARRRRRARSRRRTRAGRRACGCARRRITSGSASATTRGALLGGEVARRRAAARRSRPATGCRAGSS